jgi:hypothetical protein
MGKSEKKRLESRILHLFVETNHLFVETNHLFVETNHLFVETNHLFVGMQDLCVQSNKTGPNKTRFHRNGYER